MCEQDGKIVMSWNGMIFQTAWRFGMISARITALLMLALKLEEWIIIILCKDL